MIANVLSSKNVLVFIDRSNFPHHRASLDNFGWYILFVGPLPSFPMGEGTNMVSQSEAVQYFVKWDLIRKSRKYIRIGKHRPFGPLHLGEYVGNRPQYRGEFALVASSRDYNDQIVAQFNNPYTGLGFGWWLFRRSDFRIVRVESFRFKTGQT